MAKDPTTSSGSKKCHAAKTQPAPARTPVQVQYRGTMPKVSRVERKEIILKKMEPALLEFTNEAGTSLIAESFSLSAQSIEVLVPEGTLEYFKERMTAFPEIAIQPVKRMQVVPE